jgi:hypothetical protein
MNRPNTTTTPTTYKEITQSCPEDDNKNKNNNTMSTSLRGFLWTLVGLAAAQVTTAQQEAPPYYTPGDDASWAIQSNRLSAMLGEDKQKLYDKFMTDCEEASTSISNYRNCASEEGHRLYMNQQQPSSV